MKTNFNNVEDIIVVKSNRELGTLTWIRPLVTYLGCKRKTFTFITCFLGGGRDKNRDGVQFVSQ